MTTESEQNSEPEINFNIKHFNGILVNVQTENVQNVNHASTNKNNGNAKKKKRIYYMVNFLAFLFTCIGYVLRWFELIKEFILNISEKR